MFSLKPLLAKGFAKHVDVFDVEPSRAQIASHSHMYATVTFCPPSMQSFTAQLEAAVDGVPPNQAKGRNLLFEVRTVMVDSHRSKTIDATKLHGPEKLDHRHSLKFVG